MRKSIIIIIIINLFVQALFSQEDKLKKRIDELAATEKGLEELVQINVSKISLYDFITAISNEHKLNVSIDASLDQPIINNFYNVKVKDVLLFLIKKHNIDVEVLGRIISLKKKKKEEKVQKVKLIDVSYNKEKDLISLNLNRDTLFHVAKEITFKTGRNIIISPDVKNKLITTYIVDKPFGQVMEMLSKSNGLQATKDKNGVYFIDKYKKEVKKSLNKIADAKIKRRNKNLDIKLNGDGSLNISADEVRVSDIIYNAASQTKRDYLLYSKLDPSLVTSIFVERISFAELLKHALKGTRYTFKRQGDYFLIGEKNLEGLRSTELIQMENRTIESVINVLPSRITAELEIKEFPELNGIVVSGPSSIIEELKNFLKHIDKNVPVVQIEVIFVQYEKSYDIQTGLQAGISKNKTSSLSTLFPTSDVTLNSGQVNELIDAFNGLGIINLGKVASKFYLTLRALENNSIIKLESTPKISTLNGHEASFKIGATDYYFEQTNRLITGGVNNDVLQSGQWRPTEANLSLKIKPFVSKDEDVTLKISVEKSAFTGRVGENAPPSKSTQQFESLIRVKNGDMILLGGLDEVEKSNSGTGTPFFSRIPIIKWFFSGRKKKKSKKKLHMFIKPTVYY